MYKNTTTAELIWQICFSSGVCTMGFEGQVWGVNAVAFSHRLDIAGLFTFMVMQETRQARARSFSTELDSILASSLRGGKKSK